MVQGQGLTPPPSPFKVRVPLPLPHGVGWCGMDIAIGVVNVMPYCKCYGIGNMLVSLTEGAFYCLGEYNDNNPSPVIFIVTVWGPILTAYRWPQIFITANR